MSEAGQREENQQWASDKPMLDNAWKLRGIFIIDPDDGGVKETIKKKKKKTQGKIGDSDGSGCAL